MKLFTILVILLVLTSAVFAIPPEINSWQQYPSFKVAKTAPVQETITLSPIWTLDCSLDADTLVGKISSASGGTDGRTLLLDSQLVQILVISPDGIVENITGRAGEGPEDLPGAYRHFQLQNGRIGVAGGSQAPTFVMGRGKIVMIEPDGQPAGMWHGAGAPKEYPLSTVRELRCANDHILVASQYLEMDGKMAGTVSELAILNPENGERNIVARRAFQQEMAEQDFPEAGIYEPFAYGRCDISQEGRIAFAPVRDQWLVVIREPNGKGFVLERRWPTLLRPPAEIEDVQKAAGMRNQKGICKTNPAIGRVRWRPDGNLWIESMGIELLPDALACFDEFDKTGRFLRRVQLKTPGNPKHDVLIIMENGNFALLRGFKRSDSNDSTEIVDTEVILLKISDLLGSGF